MDKKDYVKVLLYAYPQLDALRDAVECGVEVKAVLSFRDVHDAAAVCDRIAEEIVSAKKLALVKNLLDRILERCTTREKYLLEYKYFRRKRMLQEEFADVELNCAERSYYRLQNAVLEKIAMLLLAEGMSEEKFLKDFQNYAPFMRLYDVIREGRERAIVFKRVGRPIAFRQKSSGSGGGDFLPRRTKAAITTSAPAARQTIAICAPESPAVGTGFSKGVSPTSPPVPPVD